MLLLDNSGRQLIATAASGLEEEVSQGVRIPVGRGFAGRIAAGRRPVILDHVDHGNVLNPILYEKGIRSLAGVPLLVHGAVLGVLHVGTVHNRIFTPDGLVERRDEPIDVGITRLCQVVTPGPPEDVCVSLMHALVGSQYPGDDVALLVLRWLRGQAPASTAPAPGERRP